MHNLLRSTPAMLHIQLLLICSLFFLHSISMLEAYRVCIYFLACLTVCTAFLGERDYYKKKRFIIGLTAVFSILFTHSLLNHYNIFSTKEFRHVLLAAVIYKAVSDLAKSHNPLTNLTRPEYLTAIVGTYVATEVILFFLFSQPNGSAKNPHYLSYYLTVYIHLSLAAAALSKSFWLKAVNALLLLPMGYLLLEASSRPMWIGLFCSATTTLFFLKPRKRWAFASAIIVLFSSLYLSNLSDFKSRVNDLIENASTEERAYIWHDTVVMQNSSSLPEWLLGHGMNSYEDDFNEYSSYYKNDGITFNQPHNGILELLYTVGITGLTSYLLIFYIFIKKIYSLWLDAITLQKKVTLVLLTTVYICCSISTGLTLSIFGSIYINIIAAILAITFSFNTEKSAHEKSSNHRYS